MKTAATLLLAALPALAAAAPRGDESPAPPAADRPDDLHRRYGFDGLIVSKLDDGLFDIASGDVDGDGHLDLAVVNNNKARIQLLLHRPPGEPLAEEALELVNELPDEVHFRRESLATEQKVWALELADLDGDGRADVAFTGDSNKLTVAYSDEGLEFSRRLRLDIEEGVADASSLRAGDVDGDGRADLVLATRTTVELFLQTADGELRRERSLARASAEADGFDLADLDGDGLLDLLHVVSESDWPLRVQLGQPGAAFGPEMRTRLAQIRGFRTADLDGDGAAEVLVVGRRSGRASVLSLQTSTLQDDELGAPRILPFARLADASKREVVLADLDKDGLVDVLLAEPGAARLVTWRGAAGGQFHAARHWPSLMGSSRPRVGDLDGDGLPEIVLAAPDENAVALVQVAAQGQLSFPELLAPPGGELLALGLGDTEGDGAPETWVVVADGRGRSRTRTLRRLGGEGEGGERPLENLSTDPSDLLLLDLDRDGRDDLLLFVPTELPRILLTRETGFLEVDTEAPGFGILKGVTRAAVFFGDVDGDGRRELLVPGSNFARAVHLDGQGQPVVVGQYNLDEAAAKVGAVAAADLHGDGVPEVLLVDESRQRLVALVAGEQGHRTFGTVELSGLLPRGILVADVDADGRQDAVLWAAEQLALVSAGGRVARLVPDASYESPVKDAFLDRIAAGDVNGDGLPDVVFTETSKHLLHVAAFLDGQLQHALRFPVFEGRLFETSRRSSREPREVAVADATGDGLPDIVILVHDRLVVYPQEPAP